MRYRASFSGSGTQLIVPMTFERCSLPILTYPSQLKHFSGNALIDTGATHTAIYEGIPVGLGMIPTGRVTIATPSQLNVVCNQYMMKLTFPDTNQFIDNFRVTATVIPFSSVNYPIHCLIGMDILSYGNLVYNGEDNTFELVFK